MQKAIFLDRDGTLVLDTGYVHRVEDFCLLPDVIESLKLLRDNGFLLFIVTNQSGIGRKYFTLEHFMEFNNTLYMSLAEHGIQITKTYYCPHAPTDACDCRKPKDGLLKKAILEYQLNPKNCWMIGDRKSDIQAGQSAGMNTGLITEDNGLLMIAKKIVGDKDE